MSETVSILSGQGLSNLYTSIRQHNGKAYLLKTYMAIEQDAIQEKLFNTLLENTHETTLHEEIMGVAFHLCRFGHSKEVQENCLDLLTLIRDAKINQSNQSIQLKLLKRLIVLSEPDEFESSEFNQKSQLEILPFLWSSDQITREQVILYYIDVKNNKFNNILHLPETCYQDPKYAIAMSEILVSMMSDGPKSYPLISNKGMTIKSEDISVKYFNQFLHGKLGLGTDHCVIETRKKLIEEVQRLSLVDQKVTDETKRHYLESMSLSATKFLIKYHEIGIKEIPDNLSQEELQVWIDHIQGIHDTLGKLKLKKLDKPISKAKEKYLESINHLYETLARI